MKDTDVSQNSILIKIPFVLPHLTKETKGILQPLYENWDKPKDCVLGTYRAKVKIKLPHPIPC
ncbi:MAG: hypothetical protein KA270_19295 [Saprospiraceae bacterium]|nr:hypothetical protein [Saprospiraceae bacterium]